MSTQLRRQTQPQISFAETVVRFVSHKSLSCNGLQPTSLQFVRRDCRRCCTREGRVLWITSQSPQRSPAVSVDVVEGHRPLVRCDGLGRVSAHRQGLTQAVVRIPGPWKGSFEALVEEDLGGVAEQLRVQALVRFQAAEGLVVFIFKGLVMTIF